MDGYEYYRDYLLRLREQGFVISDEDIESRARGAEEIRNEIPGIAGYDYAMERLLAGLEEPESEEEPWQPEGGWDEWDYAALMGPSYLHDEDEDEDEGEEYGEYDDYDEEDVYNDDIWGILNGKQS